MKKLVSMVVALAMVCCLGAGLVGCGGTNKGDTFTLTHSDVTLEENETKTLNPVFNPTSANKEVTYSYDGNNIVIAMGKVKGLIGDTETTVTAKAGSVSTTFKVKVNKKEIIAPTPDEGSLFINGGFETGDFTGWDKTGSACAVESKTDSGNNVITGSYGLKLWHSATVALDFTLSQKISPLKEKYTFSAQIKGSVGSMTLTVKNGETELNSVTVTDLISQTEARRFGFVADFTNVADVTNIVFSVHVTGAANVWGGIDDIKTEQGEVALPDYQTTESQNSFARNGGFEEGASQWALTKSGGTLAVSVDSVKFGAKKLGYYGGDESSTFSVAQTLNNLPAGTLTLSAWVMGEGAGTISLFLGQDSDKQTAAAKLEGFAAGYQKVIIEGVAFQGGTLVFGLEMTKGAVGLWANIDGIELLIEGETPAPNNEAFITGLTVNGVETTGTETLAVTLDSTKFAALTAAAADAKSLIGGTLAYKAVLTSASFDTDTKVLTVVVTAEDGIATKSYSVTVTEDTGIIPNVDVSMDEAKWTFAAADTLSVSGGKISYGNDQLEGPSAAVTLTSELTAITAGNYKIKVSYAIKHGAFTLNGQSFEDLAASWAWTESETTFATAVTVGADGNLTLTLTLTPGTYSFVEIRSITLIPVTE